MVLSWKSNTLIFWPLIVLVIILSSDLCIPRVGVFITRIWFNIASVLGWFSSKIVLTLLYYLVIVPYGFFVKCFYSKDILKIKPNESLFIERNKKITSKDLENPW